MSACFADRLGGLITLSAAERDALAALEQRERVVRRGAVLRREGEANMDLFVVRDGMMMRYVLMDDGSRQILQLMLPGELVGAGSLAFARAPDTIAAASDSIVCPVDRGDLGRLGVAHPRLLAAIMALQQIERVAITDRLASLGRTSGKSRVATVLLELRDRLHRDQADAGFALGLTQEEIGDMTGLTAVHVNRMLRQLEDEGSIDRSGGKVRIVDGERLARAANYVDRYAKLDLGWLPSPEAGRSA